MKQHHLKGFAEVDRRIRELNKQHIKKTSHMLRSRIEISPTLWRAALDGELTPGAYGILAIAPHFSEIVTMLRLASRDNITSRERKRLESIMSYTIQFGAREPNYIPCTIADIRLAAQWAYQEGLLYSWRDDEDVDADYHRDTEDAMFAQEAAREEWEQHKQGAAERLAELRGCGKAV